MRMEVHSPVKLTFRLQERPDEVLDLATAFSKQPDEVRAALLDAIRQVELRSIDIELLRIENISRLKPITQDCRQDYAYWKAPNSLRWKSIKSMFFSKYSLAPGLSEEAKRRIVAR
jgi:hypothetical protein